MLKRGFDNIQSFLVKNKVLEYSILINLSILMDYLADPCASAIPVNPLYE